MKLRPMTKNQREQRCKSVRELMPKIREDQRKKAEGARRAGRIVMYSAPGESAG